MTNLNGKIVSVSERVSEIEQRYNDINGKFYDSTYARLTREIRQRVLIVGRMIENLLK